VNEPLTDSDGFALYTCSTCHKVKIAPLFTPSEINGGLRCRLCMGEVNRKRYGTPVPRKFEKIMLR
jgi:hypothetical protein